MTDLTQVRDDFVDYLRRQVVGPFGGEHEVIADTPNRRYLMGILFPRQVGFESYVEREGEQTDNAPGSGNGEENLFSDDPVAAANDFLPASQGLSFFTSSNSLRVFVSAARYETLEGAEAEQAVAAHGVSGEATESVDDDPRRRIRRVWRRLPLPRQEVRIGGANRNETVFEGRGELHVRWRRFDHGSLVTVTLVNATSATENENLDRMWDDMLLQADIEVRVDDDGEILEYPSLGLASHDPEEDELRLLYRDAKTYAVGHGCAADWETGARVRRLRSEVMPRYEVPRVKASGARTRALDLAWLADPSRAPEELFAELRGFVDGYRSWVRRQHAAAAGLPPRQAGAAARVLERLDTALERMVLGAKLLRDEEQAREAFRLANEVMLRQMRHSEEDLAGTRHRRVDAPRLPAGYEPGPMWRPFQLGFALVVLTGLVHPEHEDRDLVDLIWFPTGGGKTEAYLLVAVFEIFRRRLRDGDAGAGTVVISRYTLTLLTTQQFQRSATTICAAERVCAENPDLLGNTPVSVGLWVGQGMTPNRYADAREVVDKLHETDQPEDDFVLERCPWCGTEIVPRSRSEDLGDYGIRATDTSFGFHCPSARCPFHESLPVHVVDDDLYDHPPTFLLGTVDKFAGLAWEPRSGVFFGRSTNRTPPTLIIQDELHLLTGPLGTTVGLYEAAIERLCEHSGRLPKVISSTATIRRADDQVRGLFGRQVRLFPPTGLTAEDSYFATVDRSSPGRLYVGLMAQGHTADTSTVHSAAAILQAPVDLGLKDEAQDAYWTLIAYHSSLRELGRTVTIARDDVTARLQALVQDRPVREFDVEELTSNVERSLQPRLLERLNLPCWDADHIDFLATTNMLSVGVDVPRLSLMLMNGQPKATAEYIQATSRVGRDRYPGLIVSLFRATRPRDRSHYENFRPYHTSLYRHVEPTSVTPFSPPSRARALHAALVILVRHHLGLAADNRAGDIRAHLPTVRGYLDELEAVVRTVEPREALKARQELDFFVEDWVARANAADHDNKVLYYKPNGRGQRNLLCDFNTRGDAWPTLRSLRNVDRETVIDVLKATGAGRS